MLRIIRTFSKEILSFIRVPRTFTCMLKSDCLIRVRLRAAHKGPNRKLEKLESCADTDERQKCSVLATGDQKTISNVKSVTMQTKNSETDQKTIKTRILNSDSSKARPRSCRQLLHFVAAFLLRQKDL